jgi:hypothetical protein
VGLLASLTPWGRKKKALEPLYTTKETIEIVYNMYRVKPVVVSGLPMYVPLVVLY